MLSGGFDSAVAAWRAMKRGVAVDFVLLNLGGRAHERTVLSIIRVLLEAWGAGQRSRLHVIEFDAAVQAIKMHVRPQYWQVVLKRLMYRAAQAVAREIGAEALITGESIGQVSSQTLANLAAIDAVAEMPVLRPLIGQDKTEIIAEARRIGTAALSEHVKEHCDLSAHFPVTATDRVKVDRQEQKLDLSVVFDAIRNRRAINPFALTREDSRQSYLFTNAIPSGAVVIDCQPPHRYRAWHAPGAEHHEPGDLIDKLRRFDKRQTYVVYCAHGSQAAYLAELMQRSGYDAYAFEGGADRLRRSLAPDG
jgi:thiamine biosynthesis protein ThiI